MPESLLVNFVYCHPVGHAIEALHAAHGYHRADPELRISVALLARWPDARFCFVGKLARDGRTTTGFTAGDFAQLRAAVPVAVDAVDVPLVEQLAEVAACDMLISPHSGFGMAALAAGTPWLSIKETRGRSSTSTARRSTRCSPTSSGSPAIRDKARSPSR
jgi:hypothetical protein